MNFLEPYLLEARKIQGFTWLKGTNFLDYGCDEGTIKEILPNGCHYVGLDINTRLLSRLRRSHPENEYITPKELKGFPNGYFDTILMYSVFEHLIFPKDVLKELKRVLHKHGRIIIITVTPKAELALEALAFLKMTNHAWLKEHVAYYTNEGIKQLVEDAKMKIVYFKYFEFGLNQFVVVEK
jgi:ubiquinone/menaquinone biosynthesis C-methylase UbiE